MKLSPQTIAANIAAAAAELEEQAAAAANSSNSTSTTTTTTGNKSGGGSVGNSNNNNNHGETVSAMVSTASTGSSAGSAGASGGGAMIGSSTAQPGGQHNSTSTSNSNTIGGTMNQNQAQQQQQQQQNQLQAQQAQQQAQQQQVPANPPGKSTPKDTQVVAAILKEMGITEYEPRVLPQLVEFAYRYASRVLEDAQLFSSYAKKKNIDSDDVGIAVQMQMERAFVGPPPRDALLEIARNKNNQPLPPIKSHNGMRLPADRYSLVAPNLRLVSTGNSAGGGSHIGGQAQGNAKGQMMMGQGARPRPSASSSSMLTKTVFAVKTPAHMLQQQSSSSNTASAAASNSEALMGVKRRLDET
ncbi:PREDICTED: transcription initiation factor TFIID subunit 9-like [Rhagoletis zephyria]|uniref:transcription initiation factor TFIID subunit 9-like n=1 Tax=Rhagoletis zephyria TaxID=28612 RepID=UPI0008113ED8|nr:PREDICTED: transcription initiation factor TFIID subunit 9-like [Rhagoletis zephyria]